MDGKKFEFNRGDQIVGYSVLRVEELKEIQSVYYELIHHQTGARHIHISNSDNENTFSVAFKTVPKDSTGVAHILEHTVLCGSKKFPVRDPFFSMIKRSLSTFMNAFTSSDWTMYPFSTQNKKDFYNLMDVYLDAAFFPKIEELNFKQEGHRLEFEPDESGKLKLVYKGIVYNEMKGAMSSPSQVMIRYLMNALYPDTTYHFNSGGDPAVIPTLTHEQLVEFHKRHYHPSNSFFYTYGNFPLKDHLEFIHTKVLSQFTKIDPQTDVPSQPRWNAPKVVSYSYPIAPNEDPTKKYQICLAWLTSDVRDTFEILTLALLTDILLGNAGSPLRKALIESGLGSSLSDGTGFESENRDTMFSCGLKDVEESAADKIQSIVFDVLTRLAEQGIDKKLIESALHQFEFHRKEKTNYPYPYGIKLLLYICSSWFHGGDPVQILKFDEQLNRLHQELETGIFLENRIRKYFLENPHRVLFKLVPDKELDQKEARRVREELDRLQMKMTEEEIEKIRRDAEALKQLQESKEDISVLPTLEISDIPPTIIRIEETTSKFQLPTTVDQFHVTIYEQPTSGIFYFTAAFGTGFLKQDVLPLVPFFCYVFSKIGTQKRSYADMAINIDTYTGGIGAFAQARIRYEPIGDCLPFVTINGKCLTRNLPRMMDIIQELLYEFDVFDISRIKNLILEYKAGIESAIVHNGHRLAMSLASRHFSVTHALNEMWNGVHQLKTIKKITDNLTDETISSVCDKLNFIGKTIFSKNNIKIALTGEEAPINDAINFAYNLQNGLPAHPTHGFIPPSIEMINKVPKEGWSTSTSVSFVASAFETVRLSHEDSPILSVIGKLVKSLFIHREIREKGGAYGGYASYNPEDGLFSLSSYRDPHILETLKVFDQVKDFIRNTEFTDDDIKEAILQICSDIDKPDPPGPAAKKAFLRKLLSLTDDMRAQYKARLLTVNRLKVKEVADKYFTSLPANTGIAVISNEVKLQETNSQSGGFELYQI